jgi:hypothetical protein
MHTCTCTSQHVCTHKHHNPIHIWRGTFTHAWASNHPCHHVFHSIHLHQTHSKIPANAHAEILQFLHANALHSFAHMFTVCVELLTSLHPLLSCCVVLHYYHAFVVLWLAGSPCIPTCCIHALHHRMLCVVVMSLCVVLSQPARIRRLVLLL